MMFDCSRTVFVRPTTPYILDASAFDTMTAVELA